MKRLAFSLTTLAACSHASGEKLQDAGDVARGIALTERFEGSKPSKRLLVMVGGATDRPEDLVAEGFIPELRLHNNHDDILVSYWNGPRYSVGEAIPALHEQIVATREQRGYEEVVSIGISAGGLVALDMARLHPNDVSSLLVYAPYLGPDMFRDEIQAAGGLKTWSPEGPVEEIERTWQWLSGYATGKRRPPLVILFGEDDDLRGHFDLLTPHLPKDRVFTTPGEHSWDTLRALWPAVLDADPLSLTGS